MDEQASPLERDHTLRVVLPGGQERDATVHGSKPLMDLLVSLCASYHLNPSDYTMEVLSPNKNVINFKPNSPVGLLDAEKLVLKPKGVEEKITKPYMPEATVRLLINYNKAHKTVVRVSPKLPLEMLLPIVCDKCEFNVETTVLLRDSRSEEPLDLSVSLNEHGLREVFAKDTGASDRADRRAQRAETPSEKSSLCAAESPKKQKKQKENSGFLRLFRRRKKELEAEGTASAPISPARSQEAGPGSLANGMTSSKTLPLDVPKKRRAPPPPIAASQSIPTNLSSCHVENPQRCGESTLKSTKRRAPPPPPCANTLQEQQANTDGAGARRVSAFSTVAIASPEDPTGSTGSDCVNLSDSPLPPSEPEQAQSPSDRSMPNYFQEASETRLPSLRGRDLSDARSALARVLMSSVSKSSLVKRLSQSATFTKLHNGSSCVSTSMRRTDDGDFHQGLESVLNSDLPTENKWEELEERRGLTTFKVVPPKNDSPPESDVTPRSPELSQRLEEDCLRSEASPDLESPQTMAREDSNSAECGSDVHPNGSEIRLSSEESSEVLQDSGSPPVSPASKVAEAAEDQVGENPEEVPTEEAITVLAQSIERVSTKGDVGDQNGHGCSTDADGPTVFPIEEVKEEEDANFPPPPPPVFFSEHADVPAEASPPPSPALCKHSPPEDRPTSPLPKRSTSLSRFAQAVTMAVQRSRLQNIRKVSGPPESVGAHKTTPSSYQYGA